MDKPLRRAMSNPKAVGWVALWAIELSEFDMLGHMWIMLRTYVICNWLIL